MRVAALYDIHGNLPALEAVLAEVRHSAVELVIVGGDVIPEMARALADASFGPGRTPAQNKRLLPTAANAILSRCG